MDSLINAAGRALAAGDALGALKRVALREDAPALALRGIAMAQLGDFERAKGLLKRAARAFGPREAVAGARCLVAEAEIALASRDLAFPVRALEAAARTLAGHGDATNAAHARNLIVRRLLLIGHVAEAEAMLEGFDPAPLPPAVRASHEIAVAGSALRRLKTETARAAFQRARRAAEASGIPALATEVAAAAAVLEAPAARLVHAPDGRLLGLAEVEALFASDRLVVDACRNVVRRGEMALSLATRPVLFALARTLAEAWPADASREALLARAFRAREADESHRARLRVEIGRLRAELTGLAEIEATEAGFVLVLADNRDVAVIAPPVEAEHGALLALLSDGEAWSTSALSIALGASARTVQRALETLHAGARVTPVGRGRARRWMVPPLTPFPTILLLPGLLPGD
jgi:hypothetical protein